MSVRQLSIWDNVALEQGYHLLFNLKFEEATIKFQEALLNTRDQEILQKAIEASLFWQTKLPLSNYQQEEIINITDLLTDYAHYPFSIQMRPLRKSILSYIVSLIGKRPELNIEEAEDAFDLLLELGTFQEAETLISIAINRNPEKYYLFYYLAQAQWLQQKKSTANSNYTKAMLLFPDNRFVNRIENDKITNLIQHYGLSNTPAHGWVKGNLPMINASIKSDDNIKFLSPQHQKAKEAYQFLIATEMSLKDNDIKLSIQYRKKLKNLDPDLYEAYFELLKKRK